MNEVSLILLSKRRRFYSSYIYHSSKRYQKASLKPDDVGVSIGCGEGDQLKVQNENLKLIFKMK